MTRRISRRDVIVAPIGGLPLVFGQGGLLPTIRSITLSNNTFVGGSADGTVVGAISVQTTSGTFAGTIALGGTDATKFKLSSTSLPANLELNGTQAAGSYSITLTATDASFANSPFGPITFGITGTSTSARHLWDLTAINDTASTLTAGTYFLQRGLVFADGDLPAGTYPQLLVSGVAQPYTPYMITTWPSGAVKRMSVLIRPTFSLTASATQAIGVWNSGTAPAASGRTLTDLYNQSLSVQAVAAPVSGANITGTWGAWAASDTNNYAQYTLGDGQAGLVGKLRLKMALTQGGTPHGQLECDLFFALLNDGSNALGGVAFLARMIQPYYDIDSPAKNPRAFSSISYQYGAGPTTVAWPFPFTTAAFTATSGSKNLAISAGAGNLFQGGVDFQNVPVYLTGGALPTGLDGNTIYSCMIVNASSTTITLGTPLNGGNPRIVPSSNGSGTLNPCFSINHFGTLFGATASADWNIVQGTGSITSPAWCRAKLGATADQVYWASSKVLPPYDTSLIGSISNGTFAYNWNPESYGPLNWEQEDTGSAPGLGWIAGVNVRHFFTQSATDELIAKMIGLAGGFESYNFRDSTSKNLINLSGSNYTGMAAASAAQQAIRWGSGGTAGSWTIPPANNTANQLQSQTDMSHCPEFGIYPFLILGRPEYADIMCEMANGAVLVEVPTTNSARNVTTPITATGICTGYVSQQRAVSWATRNVMAAAGLLPDSYYDGSQITQYFKDNAANSLNWIINGIMPSLNSYCNTNGIYMNWQPSTGRVNLQSPWQTNYMMGAIAWAYGLLGDANAKTILENHATFLLHVLNTFGGWSLYTYHYHLDVGDTGSDAGTGPITDDTQFGGDLPGTSTWNTLSWGTTSPAFSITGPSPGNKGTWQYSNGDKLIFDPAQTGTHATPVGFTSDQPYYIVNVTKTTTLYTFDLANSIGGTAIIPTTAGSQSGGNVSSGDGGPWGVPQSSSVSVNSSPTSAGADSYVSTVKGIAGWIKFLGLSSPSLGDLAPIITDAQNRLTAAGVNWDQWQGWALSSNPS